MQRANIIVMGKTGAGKSTLINSLLGEKVAETGFGRAVTQENKKYCRQIIAPDGLAIDMSVYDTVGLEIDNDVTRTTIEKISNYIDKTEKDYTCDEVTVVWFCVNWKCNRFEKYELELILELSIEKCIPFIIVVTQCFENSVGELEREIKEMLPEMPTMHILAEDYSTRAGKYEAYGVQDLFKLTLNEYPRLKVSVAKAKFESFCAQYEERKRNLERKGNNCIYRYSRKAGEVGWIPGGCVPLTQQLCNKMMNEMNDIFGLSISGEKFDAFIVSIVVAPLMTIPFLSVLLAKAYIESIGEGYLKALLELVDTHANYEIETNEVILNELKKNLEGEK